MCKVLALIFVVFIGCVSARTGSISFKSIPIEGIVSPFKQGENPIDWCPQCINSFNDLIESVLDVILQYGILNSCGDLCALVANKSQSEIVDFLCTFGCAVLGVKEFVKLIENADIDPIYYCEVINLCPINDNGDATFTSFAILPDVGVVGTKYGVDFVFVTKNGTGTGEIYVKLDTVDNITLENSFLLEAQKPGTYGQRMVVDATPDPDCDPTQEQCEEWLPGIYNITIQICDGQCGSRHNHTQLYDTARGSFQIKEE